MAEKMSLETTAESLRGQCRRDLALWFVPDTVGNGGRKRLVENRVRRTISDGDDTVAKIPVRG